MSNDLYHIDAGGDLSPLHPGGQGLPASAPAEFNHPDYWLSETGSPHGVSAPPLGSFFGQPVPGAKPAELQQFIKGIGQLAVDEFRARGVHPPYISAIVGWFEQSAQRPLKPQYATHHYDLSGIPYSPEDKVPLVNFCDAMDDAGVPPAVVRLALSWYYIKLPQLLQQSQPSAPMQNASYITTDELSDAEFAQVDRRSHTDKATCESILSQRWGNNYRDNLLTVWRYVKSQGQDFIDFMETAVAVRNGTVVMVANDPDVIEELFKSATGISAPSADVNAEIAAIEKLMKAGSPEYWKSDVTQARYRELLRARDR